MEDFNGNLPLTFGSFTLEDTLEFKRSYCNSSGLKDNAAKLIPTSMPARASSDSASVSLKPAAKAPARDFSPRSPEALPTSSPPEKFSSEALGWDVGRAASPSSRNTGGGGGDMWVASPGSDDKQGTSGESTAQQPMSWARVAAGHAKSSARTAAAPAPDVDAADDRWMRAGQGTGRTQRRVDEVDVVDVLNAGVAMGSADEGGAKADGDAAGGFSPTASGTPGAGAAVETAREMAQTIASGETKTMKPSARFDSASSAAEVDGRQKQQQVGEESEASGDSGRPANGGGQGAEACVKGGDANAATLQAEVEARPRRTMQALVVMLGSEDGAGPKSADAVALRGGEEGLAPGDLVHRGMVNTGNNCFRNSVLQALLACEPFVSVLFRAVPGLRDSVPAQETLPTWAQLARFAAAFEPPKPGSSALLVGSSNQKGLTEKGRGGGWSTPVGRAKGGARRFRAPGGAEAVVPDEVMSRAFGLFRSSNRGEQQDAQEFLAFFLDQLHEEIVQAKKVHAAEQDGRIKGSGYPPVVNGVDTGGTRGGGGQQGESEWLEIGKGGAKAVLNTPNARQSVSKSSVVTGMFYGMFRSEVKKKGTKLSVTLEPFHCLQLDLDPPKVPPHPSVSHSYSEGPASSGSAWGGTSAAGGAENGARGGGAAAWGGSGVAETSGSKATVLDEALAALFGAEAVAGVTGRQNVEVKASRKLTLERAPKVLTLHLKQFAFDAKLGPRKLARRVRYPPELTIPNHIMSPSLLHEASNGGPLKYRLFTVVLHHGRSIHGGHYTALVRDARGQWRHCDDQHVSPETEGHALNPTSGHPYLLLYTRL